MGEEQKGIGVIQWYAIYYYANSDNYLITVIANIILSFMLLYISSFFELNCMHEKKRNTYVHIYIGRTDHTLMLAEYYVHVPKCILLGHIDICN